MSLKQLTANSNSNLPAGEGAREVRGLTADSRKVQKGFLFAAFSGTKENGASYIQQAIERGATAIITAPDVELPRGASAHVAHLRVANPRKEYALMASRFYPSQYSDIVLPRVVAVTGTNGKTSMAIFARHIWHQLGFKAAAIGTLGLLTESFRMQSSLTTPSADIIHRMLSGLARRSYQRVALEASSHGLAQYRLDGVKLAAVVFTRLGQDHLDYHKNQQAYFESKMRLVREILPTGGLFVCDEDAPGAKDALHIAEACGHNIIRVGERSSADIRIKRCESAAAGQKVEVLYAGNSYEIDFPLVGKFQVVNALLAAGAVLGTEEQPDPAAIFATLASAPSIPGRLEKIATQQGATIFIDYAHTPDALEAALGALRAGLASDRGRGGRLHLVFGAGGDRDKDKRPLMARVAQRLADEIIITDDNPRFEDAAAIRAALQQVASTAANIGDRATAIATAMKNLKQNDILLVAGKGHENYQERAGKQIKFSDAETIRALVRA